MPHLQELRPYHIVVHAEPRPLEPCLYDVHPMVASFVVVVVVAAAADFLTSFVQHFVVAVGAGLDLCNVAVPDNLLYPYVWAWVP